MSDGKKKRLGLKVAIAVIALHVVGLAVYFLMSRTHPDPRLVGHWYGFHEEAGYTYDFLSYRGPDGKFDLQVRVFEDGSVPGAVAATPPAELKEAFRDTISGEWHSDGAGYATAEKGGGDPFGPQSVVDKIRWWIQFREWPDDKVAYDYRIVRLSEESVAYRNPATSREFWNVRIPAGSSFPERPLREEAAREHFRAPLPPAGD